MSCLGHQDEFPIVSALVCMIAHWREAMMNHDIDYQVVMIHQTTILYGLSTLREY